MSPRTASSGEPQAAPLWFRAMWCLIAAAVLVPLSLLTFVAFAWRATEPTWLLPLALILELLFGVSLLTVIRSLRRRLFAVIHDRSRNVLVRVAPALAVAFAFAAAFATCHGDRERSSKPAEQKRVAVVGAGAAGVHAAWMLDQAGMDYTVYEASDRIGGHAHAEPFELANGDSFPVDVGFIFGAPRGYEEMKALMALHGVPRTQSALTYSSRVGDEHWATEAEHTLGAEALRFHELADVYADDESLNLVPFGWWLKRHGFDDDFRREYLTPILVVLFITDQGIYEYSTRFVLAMVHGETKWVDFRKGGAGWVVGGGSGSYYEKVAAPLMDHVELSTPVTSVERIDGRINLHAVRSDGARVDEWYDEVILAVPADVARALLADRTPWESWILDQVRYEDSKVVLHADPSVLPTDEALRRNYNYLQKDEWGEEWELSGMMGETLADGRQLDPEPIGTLNPQRPLEDVRFERVWRHHAQDLWHLAITSELLPGIQGHGGVHYAGDWVHYIGHGPALRTGMKAACRTGAVRIAEPEPGARCVEATIRDPMPWVGTQAHTETLCGETGVYQYALQKACKTEYKRALKAAGKEP